MNVGPTQLGGGNADPFSPPPAAGDNSGPAPGSAHPDANLPSALSMPQGSSAPPVGATPSKVQQAWTALRRRLDRLRALDPEYASLQLDGTHDRLAPWSCGAVFARR